MIEGLDSIPLGVMRAPLDMATLTQNRDPIVVRGLAAGWQAVGWTQQILCERWGGTQVTVVRTDGGRIEVHPRRGLVYEPSRLDAAVAALEAGAEHYLIASLADLPADLRAEIRAPKQVTDAPFRRAKLWVSRPGTVAPLHRDAADNLHIQLQGSKRFLLFAPQAARRLRRRSLLSAAPNFAEFDPERPGDADRARLRGALPFEARLASGDAILIPSGWWHHVRTLEPSISASFWFGRGLVALMAHAAELYKQARALGR